MSSAVKLRGMNYLKDGVLKEFQMRVKTGVAQSLSDRKPLIDKFYPAFFLNGHFILFNGQVDALSKQLDAPVTNYYIALQNKYIQVKAAMDAETALTISQLRGQPADMYKQSVCQGNE